MDRFRYKKKAHHLCTFLVFLHFLLAVLLSAFLRILSPVFFTLLQYLLSKPKTGVGAKTGIRFLKMVKIEVYMLLLLEKISLASSSLLVRKKLQQVFSLAIWLAK